MSRLRLRFAVFLVNICRACECPRLNLPLDVERKRFAAPLCVFSFGIFRKNKLSACSLLILNSFIRLKYDGLSYLKDLVFLNNFFLFRGLLLAFFLFGLFFLSRCR